MERRQFLAAASLSTVSALAGCSSVLGKSNPNTYLAKPKDQQAKSADLVYPAWGQKLPAATMTAPLNDQQTITIPDHFSGQNFFLTFFYSHCSTVCPVMLADLRNVQAKAAKAGLNDVGFVATTFDPQQDTPTRLRSFAKEKYIDMQAGNWYFLRPKTPARAEKIVHGEYGIKFAKSYTKNDVTYYRHMAVIVLVNDKGYVERTYKNSLESKIQWETLWNDLQKLEKRE